VETTTYYSDIDSAWRSVGSARRELKSFAATVAARRRPVQGEAEACDAAKAELTAAAAALARAREALAGYLLEAMGAC